MSEQLTQSTKLILLLAVIVFVIGFHVYTTGGILKGLSHKNPIKSMTMLQGNSKPMIQLEPLSSGPGMELNYEPYVFPSLIESNTDIFFGIKSAVAMEKRIIDAAETWLQFVKPDSFKIFTDGGDAHLGFFMYMEKLISSALSVPRDGRDEPESTHDLRYFVPTQAYGCGGTHERADLCCKTGTAFSHFFEKRKENWFCWVDDDMYVLVPNLRRAIHDLDPFNTGKEPFYLGHACADGTLCQVGNPKNPCWSCATTCISRAAVKLIYETNFKDSKFPSQCNAFGYPDDHSIALAFSKHNIYINNNIKNTGMLFRDEYDIYWTNSKRMSRVLERPSLTALASSSVVLHPGASRPTCTGQEDDAYLYPKKAAEDSVSFQRTMFRELHNMLYGENCPALRFPRHNRTMDMHPGLETKSASTSRCTFVSESQKMLQMNSAMLDRPLRRMQLMSCHRNCLFPVLVDESSKLVHKSICSRVIEEAKQIPFRNKIGGHYNYARFRNVMQPRGR